LGEEQAREPQEEGEEEVPGTQLEGVVEYLEEGSVMHF